MRPASSKPYSGMPLASLDEELTSQVKKLTLLEGDRAEFKRQAEDTQAKNNEWIDKLRQQNRKLKQTRDDLIDQQRKLPTNGRLLSATTMSGKPDLRSETYWRRELDKQKHITKTLRNRLMNMQDKLKDVDNNKISYIEESPLMRQIRILESRLDKVMIKYNEANSMRETYQQVVKRLKEERVGYDNQVTAIERSLKGKQCDFEELLLLAHDASHAKEIAQAELKKYEHKRSAIKDLRDQYLTEKRGDVEQIKLGLNYQPAAQPQKALRMQDISQDGEDSSNELEQFAQAFKKLKEVTGVSDANEIIHKFKTQGMTSKSLEELRDKYRQKIEDLRSEKEAAKEQLNRIKYEGSGGSMNFAKKKLDDVENTLNKTQSETERLKVKWEKLSKTLVNVKVAVQHLSTYLVGVRTDWPTGLQTDPVDFSNLLQSINQKLRTAYNTVKNDPHFNSEKFKQSTAGIERFINKGGDADNIEAKLRPSSALQKDDSSGNEFDEQMDEQANNKIKQRFHAVKNDKVIVRNFRKYKV